MKPECFSGGSRLCRGGPGVPESDGQLQAIIRYAREHVHPVLSEAARIRIREAYVKVRSEHDPASAFACPTTRYLQSLVRMSEARARGDLRTTVLEADVDHVLAILKEGGLAEAEDGPQLRMPAGRKGSKRTLSRRLYQELLRLEDDIVSEGRVRQIAARVGLTDLDVADVIYQLNDAGMLLKTSGGYRVMDARC